MIGRATIDFIGWRIVIVDEKGNESGNFSIDELPSLLPYYIKVMNMRLAEFIADNHAN